MHFLYFPCLCYNVSDVNMTDIPVCSLVLEPPFCKHLCFWITCVCWVYFVSFSILVPSAPLEWVASCLHSLMGCEHIYLQRGFCICELETWEGTSLSCIQFEYGSY